MTAIAFRRTCSILTHSRPLFSTSQTSIARAPCILRSYATHKQKKQAIDTSKLVPGSQQKLQDPDARAEYQKAESRMKLAVEWFRKECSAVETRASGRVTPSILDPVKVIVPGGQAPTQLSNIATVGVRDGTTLLITLFEESHMKAVEGALYDSKIPNIVPQRKDSRTIMIPIPKPTVEARLTLYTAKHREAEDSRVQIRKILQGSVKKGSYDKHSIELEEFQKLADHWIGEINRIIENLKQATSSSQK